jgi:hypothetical protein
MQLKRMVAILAIVPGALLAQDTSDVTLAGDHRPDAVLSVTAGVTTGSMTFADRRVQQGITGVVRWHMTHSIAIAASPTYARMSYPASLGGGTAGGLTDLPVELGLDHSFDSEWSPALGLSLGATIPVGDKQIGLGSGSMGASVGAGIGLSPMDQLSLHLGAGKSLTDYSMFGALGASDAAWGEAEASYNLLEHLDATIGFDGDFSASDTLGAARAVALSFAAALGGPYTLTVSGGHGVSGPAARWSFALGFGTDFAGFQAIGSSSPIQRLMRSMGGNSHRGSGSGNSGSGHGRAP